MGVYVRICITREYRGVVDRFIFSFFSRPLWGSEISCAAAGINIKLIEDRNNIKSSGRPRINLI